MNNLRTNITTLAKQHGISIRKLEHTLNFSDKMISSWDTHEPKISNVVKVADFFAVSVDSLLGRKTLTDDQKTALCAKFDRLSAAQKADALRYMDFLLSQNPVKKEQEIG